VAEPLTAGPDLTAAERSVLMRLLKRGHRGIPGIRSHGMSAGAARAYIDAVQRRADQAEREQRGAGCV
jgi:hypothetical protein